MPKDPKTSQTPTRASGTHTGGPLKRTGTHAEEWDVIVGPSLETIPSKQLPLGKTPATLSRPSYRSGPDTNNTAG